MNKLEEARVRVRAKRFVKSIPSGIAIQMPEAELSWLDSQDDEYVSYYMKQLTQLAKPISHFKLGILWEKL